MRLRLSHKLSALFFVLALGAVGVTALSSERASENALDDELGKHLAGIVGVAAAAQRGDLLSTLRAGDEETLAWRNAADRLRALTRGAGLADAFLVDHDGGLLVGLSADARIGAERFLVRLDAGALDEAWRGGQPVGTRYRGHDGKPYRAAYARVVDGAGRPVALLGVEASADYYAALHVLRERSLIVALICIALSLALAVVVGRSLLRPIHDLARSAEAIAETETTAPHRRSDEFGILADAFARAKERIRARDAVTDAQRRDLERQLQARETLAKLGELSAGVAHEIRNPLNGIQLLLGLLARDLADRPQCKSLVDRAQHEIDGLEGIVSQFLQFARPTELQIARTSLADVVDGALTGAAGEIARRHVRVETRIEPIELRADVDQLKRALLNLVLNAVQASLDGGVVTVSGERDGERVRIRVRDAGAGVDEELRPRLFTPFVTSRAGGTGLGLAFAQKIANLHGGDCRLEESSSRGACFVIEVPS